MLNTILVPLDGSTLAERVLPYAVHLGRAAGARLLLVHVTAGHGDRSNGPLWEALHEPPEATARRLAFVSIAERLRAEGLAVEGVVRGGEPADVILETAREQSVGLIAMATHGRGGLGRWLYGSVADQVVRRAEVPTLLVPAAAEGAWTEERPLRVLVPLDGSVLSEDALQLLADLDARLRAELLLLRVVEPVPPQVTHQAAMAARSYYQDALGEARRYLDRVAHRLRSQAIPVSVRTLIGPPAPAIAATAREQEIDLIAMATHGRGGMARLVMGSVATGTLQRAGLPVLVVRPPALARPAQAPNGAEGELAPRPLVPTANVSLSLKDLDLVMRGLGELIYIPGGDPRLAEPAWELLSRLKRVEATLHEQPSVVAALLH
jgi:nucleotide-binding universal stress UspA family protein